MTYTVVVETSAERDLKRLPDDLLRRVDAELLALSGNPRPPGVAKLHGREGVGWRIRVRDYRVLYTIDDKARIVSVYRIRHRARVYR